MAFIDLQNGFYNAISEGLGFPAGSPFQLLQPSPPLAANDDTALWAYFNSIPPATVTSFYTPSAGNQFFSNYRGLVSALTAPPTGFVGDVGPQAAADWRTYLLSQKPIPPASQQPQLFLNWAMVMYPEIADAGAADLSSILLNPIGAAALGLMPYAGAGATPPDWSMGYAGLVSMLSTAPSRSFMMSSANSNQSLSHAWSQSNRDGLFGLWGGSSSQDTVTQKYAGSSVVVNAQFAHVMSFVATPGAWYSSAAMGNAFANQSGLPWKTTTPPNPINWGNTFDPATGNLARFAASLVVVSGMYIQVKCTAQFTGSEQQTILQNSGAGMWPFYSSSGNSGSTTSTSFDDNGALTTTIQSDGSTPIVIGCNVLPVAQFVGHVSAGAKLFQAAQAAA